MVIVPKQAISNATKRYTLVLPEELFDDLDKIAKRDGTTLKDVLRRFVKLGLYVDHIWSESPNASITIRDGDVERVVEFLI